jgi:hypothetical protein
MAFFFTFVGDGNANTIMIKEGPARHVAARSAQASPPNDSVWWKSGN